MPSFGQFFTVLKDSMSYVWTPSTSRASKKEDEKLINLKVFTKKVQVTIEVSENEIGLNVKKKALKSMLERVEDFVSIGHFEEAVSYMKLIRVKNKQELIDSDILSDIKVEENEEFFLFMKRETVDYDMKLNDFKIAGPNEKQILEKTSHFPKVNLSKPICKVGWLFLQDDMRKIIITLAHDCAYLLAPTKYADKMIRFLRQRMHNYIKHHEDASSVLCQLGFDSDRVKFALKIKANNYRLALDWLIDNAKNHQKKSEPSSSTKSTPRSSLISSNRSGSILSSSFETTSTINECVDGLLEIVNFYAEKDEPVLEGNIKTLIWMGFDVDDAREALRMTRNNVGAACAYLLGDKNPSILELRKGMSINSEVYKAVIDETKIQIHLGTPRSFLFLIGILDNHTQAMGYDIFSSHGNFMHHLVHLYHEQKHCVAVNQFNNSQIPISLLSAPNVHS